MKNLTPWKLLIIVASVLFISTVAIVGLLYSTDENYHDEVLTAHDGLGRFFHNNRKVTTLIEEVKVDPNNPDAATDPESGDPGTGDGSTDNAGSETPEYNIEGGKILNYPQYLNQADPAYGSTRLPCGLTTTTGRAHDIAYEGCFMCSYMMVAAYLSQNKWSTQEIISFAQTGSNFSGCLAIGSNVLAKKVQGAHVVTHAVSKADFPAKVKEIIDKEHGLVMHIRGHWEVNGRVYHKSNGGHYLVINGYDENGFYMLDPGSRSNTENGPITWDTLNYLPTLQDLREISK